MVIYNCSIFFKSKKLSLKKKFQDNNCRIKHSFDLFWNRISIQIITNYLEISISIVETLRVLPSRDSNASEEILTSDIL